MDCFGVSVVWIKETLLFHIIPFLLLTQSPCHVLLLFIQCKYSNNFNSARLVFNLFFLYLLGKTLIWIAVLLNFMIMTLVLCFISKIIDTNMDKQNLNYLNFVSVPDVNGCQCCLIEISHWWMKYWSFAFPFGVAGQ